MKREIIYAPSSVTFDASHLIELERWVRADAPQDVPPLLSPFDGYTRSLTERGGFRVTYIDQVSNLFLDALRVFAWTVATGLAGYALIKSPLPGCAVPRHCFAAISGSSRASGRFSTESRSIPTG